MQIRWRSEADGLTRNPADIALGDAEIVEFARCHTAQFGNRLTIPAPIVESACDVHDGSPFLGLSKLERQSLSLSFASMTLI